MVGSSRFTDLPAWKTCRKTIATLLERAGLQAGAGSLLYTWFLEPGLPVPEYRLGRCEACCRKCWR
jgi:hypothetical protein